MEDCDKQYCIHLLLTLSKIVKLMYFLCTLNIGSSNTINLRSNVTFGQEYSYCLLYFNFIWLNVKILIKQKMDPDFRFVRLVEQVLFVHDDINVLLQ